MNEEDAKKLARGFRSQYIELEYCADPPKIYGGFDPDLEHLFCFRFFDESSVGGSKYVVVSKATGAVRYLGRYGE